MRATLALLGALVAALMIPTATAAPADVIPVTHEEVGRAFDDFAAHLHGLGERFRRHFTLGDAGPERPLVTFMLDHRADLGLTSAQIQELERIRSDFQKDAIKLEADHRVAELDLAGLLRADPVDVNRVEAKIREIERLRGDLRLGRVRAIERGKAQLTAEQRAKLATMLGELPAARPRAGSPPAPQRFGPAGPLLHSALASSLETSASARPAALSPATGAREENTLVMLAVHSDPSPPLGKRVG